MPAIIERENQYPQNCLSYKSRNKKEAKASMVNRTNPKHVGNLVRLTVANLQ